MHGLILTAMATKLLFSMGDADSEKSYHDLSVLARKEISGGNYKQAEILQRSALEKAKKLGVDGNDYARALSELSWTVNRLGHSSEAESLAARALAIVEDRYGKNDTVLIEYLSTLGVIKQSLGKNEEALEILTRSSTLCQLHYGANNRKTALKTQLLARFYREQLGQLNLAESLTKSVVEILQKLPENERQEHLANAFDDLANILFEKNQFLDADTLKKMAFEEYLRVDGFEHPSVAWCLSSLANMQLTMEKFAEAESNCIKALGIQKKLLGSESLDVANTLVVLAKINVGKKQYPQSSEQIGEAIKIQRRRLPAVHADLLGSLKIRFYIATQMHENTKAISEEINQIEKDLVKNNFAPPDL